MKFLDRWLQCIDTEEVLPLFERLVIDYKIPLLSNVEWESQSPLVTAVARHKNLSHLRQLESVPDLVAILDLLNKHGEKAFLRDVITQMLSLEASCDCRIDNKVVASTILEFLPEAPYLITIFLTSQTWKNHKPTLEATLVSLAPYLLSGLALSANELHGFIRQPLSLLLRELRRLSLQKFSDLVELIALTARSAEIALDLLLEILEPETSRILVGRPTAIHQFVKCLYGIALDHIDEASDNRTLKQESLSLTMHDHKDGYDIVKSTLRIDSPISRMLKVGDHVRLSVSNRPQNAPLSKQFSMDAVVLMADLGSATFRCLHKPPAYLGQCAWTITHCGSFVTSKTMFDAITAFYSQREACCRIYAMLAGLPGIDQITLPGVELPVSRDPTLNDCQNAALEAAMMHSLTFIWGPPGTGKTHTVVIILTRLLNALPKSRFLITAPTHNAVDNILRRFISFGQRERTGTVPVRVSTQVNILPMISPCTNTYMNADLKIS